MPIQALRGVAKTTPSPISSMSATTLVKALCVGLLWWAGAAPAWAQSGADSVVPGAREAATRAVARIQDAQQGWYKGQVCASCHHQYQPAIAFQAARERGVPVDEERELANASRAFAYTDLDRAIQYTYVIEPAMDDAYRLVAAHAAGVRPNLTAAVYVRHLISRQNAAGDWDSFHQRPPSSYSDITMTALTLRAIKLFYHPNQKVPAGSAVGRARMWLEKQQAGTTEERVYQLLGIEWAGTADDALAGRLAQGLLATQQADGGWASIDGRESDAYSTAQTLVALHDAGGVPTTDPAWQRGIQFLLRTQAGDGSWHVSSRLHPPAPVSPPYFDTGYPGGHDQFISMSGAAWAIQALASVSGPVQEVAPAIAQRLRRAVEPSDADIDPWLEAVVFGTYTELKNALDGGFDPNTATANGTTVLMAAAPHADKMELLLDRGADINARAKTGFTALMVAAQYQDSTEAINLLLDRGASVRPPDGELPLFNAFPLFLASYAGNAEALKRLYEAGHDDLSKGMVLIGTSNTSPMLGAFKNGDMAVARALLDLGAPVDFVDGNNISMLGRSVMNNQVEMARLLLARGADVNHRDKLGMTPLLLAASIDFGDSEMIDLLLASGADPSATNNDSDTALDLARKYRHTHLIPRLERVSR